MKICIGCDHGGFNLKEKVVEHLKEKGYEVDDVGCYSLEAVDYPIYGKKVAESVAEGRCDRGIVICTTGIGISIAANKVKGVRAALVSDCFSAEATRLHNDANVLALGAGVVGELLALRIVDTFLNTEFSNVERHINRVRLIESNE
jgi:ribose 5-phosphate isomerase B